MFFSFVKEKTPKRNLVKKAATNYQILQLKTGSGNYGLCIKFTSRHSLISDRKILPNNLLDYFTGKFKINIMIDSIIMNIACIPR